MRRDQILSNPRLAGQVERYHTWPILRRQSVGEHTWQCMRIWHQIWGPLPAEVTTYFIWHDAGELAVGDPPFPVKQNNPDLKREYDRIEEAALGGMGGVAVQLSLEDKTRAKICDLLDMHELGVFEVQSGNKYGQPIVDDTFETVVKLVRRLPSADASKVQAYLTQSRKWHDGGN